MACNCKDYIDCADPVMSISSFDDSAGYTHTMSLKLTCDNLPFKSLESTDRTFSVQYGWDRDVKPGFLIAGYCSEVINMQTCGRDETAKASAICSESCTRTTTIPYYIDRINNIYVYKQIVQSLNFNINSLGKTATFRLKFGSGAFHKILIPKSVCTNVTESFIYSKNQVETTILTGSFKYNPFPYSEGSSTWGLYGNTINQTANMSKVTPDIACILLFPTVPSLAIPLDDDVINYGFYDYNAILGGFNVSTLPADDGGKDYFYPYWCRQMPIDSYWRKSADERWESITTKIINARVDPYTILTPSTYSLPFGSFAVKDKDSFVNSLLVHLSDELNRKGVIINDSSIGDLYDIIFKDNKIIPKQWWDIFPVTPT